MTGNLESLKDQLRCVTEDLARMGRHMAGTDWHLDRVREAEWLHRAIERMERARRERAMAN